MNTDPPEDEEERKKDAVVYVYLRGANGMEESFREKGYVTVPADACYGVAYRQEVYGE